MTESLTHPVFGDLQWEGQFSWWFTQIRLESGEWLDVIVDPGDDDPRAFVGRAAQLYCRAMDAEPEILQEAIQQKILDLYETWRQVGEPELTAAELTAQLDLTFVRIDTVVPITLSYVLGDVFGGHSVDVQLNERLQVREVNLAG
jgi:hypothetical protein